VIYPEGDWVLGRVDTVTVSDYTLSDGDPVTVERVDRDDSELLEGNIRDREADLKDAVYVGVGSADQSRAVIGTEADYDTEVVLGVRIEGLHHSEFGHVDPDGTDGIPFGTLVDRVQNAIDAELTYPNISNGDTNQDAIITNETPQVTDWTDYYRYDFDVLVSKYEER